MSEMSESIKCDHCNREISILDRAIKLLDGEKEFYFGNYACLTKFVLLGVADLYKANDDTESLSNMCSDLEKFVCEVRTDIVKESVKISKKEELN